MASIKKQCKTAVYVQYTCQLLSVDGKFWSILQWHIICELSLEFVNLYTEFCIHVLYHLVPWFVCLKISAVFVMFDLHDVHILYM